MTDVVITGSGAITPIGIGFDNFREGLFSGRSGAGPIERFDSSHLPVSFACEVSDFDPVDFMPEREQGRIDRFTQMAVAAAVLAHQQADLSASIEPSRCGCIVGSGIGGLPTIEEQHSALLEGGPRRVSPFMVPKLMPNGAAGAIAMRFGYRGPCFAVSSACASGAHAIGEAYRQIRTGAADLMIAGGSEASLTPLAIAAFARMGALSKRNEDPERASRPFDRDRDGFVFGEGAGILVLESRESARRRGAEILAEVAGYGASADAYHVTRPDPDGAGARAAILRALDDAHIDASEVDYVNAHGTSTPFNDRVETIAIRKALGHHADHVPVSSTKSQTGHLLGAAGAVEAVASVIAITDQVVPPTINLDTPDPSCDLDYVPHAARDWKVRVALSNSFGFGGQNACLVFRAA